MDVWRLARASGALVIGAAIAAGGPIVTRAGGGSDASSLATVGATFDPMTLPQAAGLSARAIRNERVVASHRGLHPVGATLASTSAPGQKLESGRTTSLVDLAAAPVEPGLFVQHDTAVGGSASPPDPSGAILGGRFFDVDAEQAWTNSTTDFAASSPTTWQLYDFFALPDTDYFFGGSATASTYRGRFVAVLPSFDGPGASCAHGWLNVAISSSGDPTQPWTRYRFTMGSMFTDAIRVGATDSLVVLSTNQWALDTGASDCLGSTWGGGRLRVMDWTDLMDGGTLSVRDVTPDGPTDYFNWVPATNVSAAPSTVAGGAAYLAGEKRVNGVWGDVVVGAITGSAKSGTAALSRNEDQSTLSALLGLAPPPATIAAFPSGNGGQDERIVSATWRTGRLWIGSTTSCRLDTDADTRACGRYILFNTATTPATVIEDVDVTDVGRDTFLPLVGFAHDGGAYFVMSASSAVAQQPIDTLADYRAAGQVLLGGPAEARIHAGGQVYTDTYWGLTGAVMADLADVSGAWSETPATKPLEAHRELVSRLRGGQTEAPGGSFTVGDGTGWVIGPNTEVTFHPDPSSPIQTVRWSAVPDVESTAGGPHLIHGVDSESVTWTMIDLADPALGGQADPTHVDAYVQWQTTDGTWSTPVLVSSQVDNVPPVDAWARVTFNTSTTVGKSASTKLSWSSSDAASGLSKFYVGWQETVSKLVARAYYYGPTIFAASYATTLGGREVFQVMGIDRAGNSDSQCCDVGTTVGAIQTNTALHFYKTWTTSKSSSYLGGSARYASSAGAYVSFTFTGRAIAFVSTKGPSRGQAEIWIDGVRKATIDLHSSTTKYRQVVYQASWVDSGSHVIKVRVVGTAGHPRVDFDGFLRAT